MENNNNSFEKEIELATTMRDMFNQTECPYDIYALLTSLGGHIENSGKSVCDFDFGIRKNAEKDFTFIIAKPPKLKQQTRFIYAQLLWILLTDMNYQNKFLWNKRPTDSMVTLSLNELIINESAYAFACEFFMPSESLKKQLKASAKGGKIDVKSVSEHFGVPDDTVIKYAKALNMISGDKNYTLN